MRPIKFRAWDLDNFGMFYTDGTNCDDGEWGKRWRIDETNGTIYFEEFQLRHELQGGEDVERECWHRPKQVLMQFTGLHDKNGKEIFEGDILACPTLTTVCGKGFKTTRTKIQTFKLEWSGFNYGSWMLESVGELDTNYRGMPDLKDCEIIGNIYEHPTLLSKEVA